MKPFSVNILKESAVSSADLIDLKTTPKSIVEQVIAFNESVSQTETLSKNIFYRCLFNYLKTNDPKELNPGYTAQIAKVEAIAKSVTSFNLPEPIVPGTESIEIKYDQLISYLRSSDMDPDVMNKVVKIISGATKKPAVLDMDFAVNILDNYCKAVMSYIIDDTNKTEIPDPLTEADVINNISKILGIGECDNYEDFNTKYRAAFEFSTVEIPIGCAKDVLANATYSVGCHCNLSSYALDRVLTPLISLLKVSHDKFEDPNKFRSVIDTICNMIICLQTLCNIMNCISSDLRASVLKTNINALNEAFRDFTDLPLFSESVTMHGEEIDKDTFFNTLDTEDFNPTEFMDLALCIDSDIKTNEELAKQQGMAIEAMYIAEGKFDELQNIDEAIGARVQSATQTAIEGIKNLIARFTEALLNGLKFERPWLNKYKNIILNNTWGDRGVTFSCYYDENHRKLIDNLKLPSVDYSVLNNEGNASAFENEESFFKAYFKDLDNAIRTMDTAKVITSDMSIADRCKYIMGAKFPEGKTNAQVPYNTLKIADMYNWLLLTDKLTNNIKQQQAVLEKTGRAYENAIKGMKATEKTQTPKTESYYSYIFEVEVEQKDVQPQPTQGTNNNPQDLKNTSQRATEQIKKTGDNANTAEAKMKIYMKVCKDVLAAELTAVRYLRSEYINLMRSIVRAKLGSGADLNKNANNQQNQPAQAPRQKQ